MVNPVTVIVKKIIKRSRQFFRAVFSKMGPADHALVGQYLDEVEKKLFYSMDTAVQKHCVNVAVTVSAEAASHRDIDRDLLIKAALLHDIGKTKGTFTIFDRIIYVLVNKISPDLATKLARPAPHKGMTRLRRALAVHVNHERLGASLAKESGLAEGLVFLLANHHNKAAARTSPELSLLIKADEAN